MGLDVSEGTTRWQEDIATAALRTGVPGSPGVCACDSPEDWLCAGDSTPDAFLVLVSGSPNGSVRVCIYVWW